MGARRQLLRADVGCQQRAARARLRGDGADRALPGHFSTAFVRALQPGELSEAAQMAWLASEALLQCLDGVPGATNCAYGAFCPLRSFVS